MTACSYSSMRDGACSVASISKTWRSAWRRRCAGHCRLLRTGVGAFRHTSHVTALANGGGAIVPNYGGFQLEEFSPDGDSQTIYCEQFETPGAMALLGDGTAWVLSRDLGVISRLRYREGVGAEPPLNRWPRSLPRDSDEDDEYIPGDDRENLCAPDIAAHHTGSCTPMTLLSLVIGCLCCVVVGGTVGMRESACSTVRPERVSITSVGGSTPERLML